MGDYGFEGAGEFGGTSVGESFNCLPDYHYTKCPNSISDLIVGRERYACLAIPTQSPDVSRECSFSGDDYRECPVFRGVKSVEKTCACIDGLKGFLGACAEADRQGAQREERRRLFKHILEGYLGG